MACAYDFLLLPAERLRQVALDVSDRVQAFLSDDLHEAYVAAIQEVFSQPVVGVPDLDIFSYPLHKCAWCQRDALGIDAENIHIVENGTFHPIVADCIGEVFAEFLTPDLWQHAVPLLCEVLLEKLEPGQTYNFEYEDDGLRSIFRDDADNVFVSIRSLAELQAENEAIAAQYAHEGECVLQIPDLGLDFD